MSRELRVTVTTTDGVLLDTVTIEAGAAELELLDRLGLVPGSPTFGGTR